MSKTRGEGRATNEKSSRIVLTNKERKRLKQIREEEEQAWAERSSKVTVRRVEK